MNRGLIKVLLETELNDFDLIEIENAHQEGSFYEMGEAFENLLKKLSERKQARTREMIKMALRV